MLAAPAGARDGYVGSQACSGCHGDIASSHAHAAHHGSLNRAADHPAAHALVRLGNVSPAEAVILRFYRANDSLRARVMSAGEQTDMVIDWAFGSGEQGVTLVSHLGHGRYLEHGCSYFGSSGLARTPGHAPDPANLAEAVGIVYAIDGSDGIRGCFECHATGVVTFAPDGAAVVPEAGVGCEACHGPRQAHLTNPYRSGATPVSPARQIELCGRCHRNPRESGSVDWNDPWNVRHAPVYLAQSRCFQAGGLVCTDCHDPPARLATEEGLTYGAVCLQCHGSVHNRQSAFEDCVGCHMPRVRPHERLRLTNHWIGIYAEQAPLQPVRR
jgi:hypothetical protein